MDILLEKQDWLAGFLDAGLEALSGYLCDIPIIADPASYSPKENDLFVCTIWSPKDKDDSL